MAVIDVEFKRNLSLRGNVLNPSSVGPPPPPQKVVSCWPMMSRWSVQWREWVTCDSVWDIQVYILVFTCVTWVSMTSVAVFGLHPLVPAPSVVQGPVSSLRGGSVVHSSLPGHGHEMPLPPSHSVPPVISQWVLQVKAKTTQVICHCCLSPSHAHLKVTILKTTHVTHKLSHCKSLI